MALFNFSVPFKKEIELQKKDLTFDSLYGLYFILRGQVISLLLILMLTEFMSDLTNNK